MHTPKGWRGYYGQSVAISSAPRGTSLPFAAIVKAGPQKEKGRGEEGPAFSYIRPAGGGCRSAGPRLGREEDFRPAG